MSATVVARKDFADAVRSKLLWGISAVFVVLTGLIVFASQTVGDAATATDTLMTVMVPAQLIVPIAGLVVGYMAIVGERRTGSIKLLYGLPHRRRDILLGKLAGRTGVMAVAVVVGFIGAAALLLALHGSIPLGSFVGFTALTALFALTFVGIAVGISAAVPTRGKAMGLALGFYLVFNFFWEALAAAVYYAVNGSIPGLKAEAWYFLLKNLSPIKAYGQAANLVFEESVPSISLFRIEDIPQGTTPEQMTLANRVVGDVPFYLEDWFGLVAMAVWVTVPIVVGYLRFRTADLG